MTKTRNRRPALINTETASEKFNALYNALEDKAAGLSATALSRSCGTWRKINRYLNMPTTSIERQEAEAVLSYLGITYKRGLFNSRTFNLPD